MLGWIANASHRRIPAGCGGGCRFHASSGRGVGGAGQPRLTPLVTKVSQGGGCWQRLYFEMVLLRLRLVLLRMQLVLLLPLAPKMRLPLCLSTCRCYLAGTGTAVLLPECRHAGHLPDPALQSTPLLPLCRWHTELVSPLLRSDYASGAAGGVAGGSPVGQPLLEWAGSAPTAQPLERSSSIPMPTPGQPAGSPSGGWLAPAASAPHALEGRLAGAAQAGERSPSPPAAPMRRGIIGSLPTFFGGQHHEPQHLQHLQRHHPR